MPTSDFCGRFTSQGTSDRKLENGFPNYPRLELTAHSNLGSSVFPWRVGWRGRVEDKNCEETQNFDINSTILRWHRGFCIEKKYRMFVNKPFGLEICILTFFWVRTRKVTLLALSKVFFGEEGGQRNERVYQCFHFGRLNDHSIANEANSPRAWSKYPRGLKKRKQSRQGWGKWCKSASGFEPV